MNKAATGNYYEHIHFCERSSALIFVHWEFKKLGEMKAASEANRNFWHIWQSAFIFFALWIPKIGWNEDGERSEPKFLTYLAQICILALSKIFHPQNFITTSNFWAPSEAGPRGPGPPPRYATAHLIKILSYMYRRHIKLNNFASRYLNVFNSLRIDFSALNKVLKWRACRDKQLHLLEL